MFFSTFLNIYLQDTVYVYLPATEQRDSVA